MKITFLLFAVLSTNISYSAPGACKKEGYSKCFNGVNWGTKIKMSKSGKFTDKFKKKICPKNARRIGSFSGTSAFLNCGNSIISDKTNYHVGFIDACHAISVEGLLVGFIKPVMDNNGSKMDEDQYLYVRSALKKKYGEPVKKEFNCTGYGLGGYGTKATVFSKNGMEITLMRMGASAKMRSTVVRYLNLDALSSSKKLENTRLGKDKSEKLKEKINQAKGAIDDL